MSPVFHVEIFLKYTLVFYLIQAVKIFTNMYSKTFLSFLKG